MAGRFRRGRGDDGYGLTELMVAMSLMSVVFIVAIAGIVRVYGATQSIDATSQAREQLRVGFQNFDRELRYATWISEPGKVGTSWYVEYATVDGQCRGLGLRADGVLRLLSWAAATPTTRQERVLVSNVSSTAPFTRITAGTKPFASMAPSAAPMGSGYAPEFYQLRIQLTATVGKVTVPFDSVFASSNASRLMPAAHDCGKGRPAA